LTKGLLFALSFVGEGRVRGFFNGLQGGAVAFPAVPA
jgi:hypothetical protein